MASLTCQNLPTPAPEKLGAPSPKRLRTFFPTPAPPSPVTVAAALTLETTFKESYLHTRNKNLRCFPSCFAGGVHMERSFCGAPVRASLATTANLPLHHMFLFGEVHSLNEPAYRVGQHVSPEQIAQDSSGKFVVGSLSSLPPSPAAWGDGKGKLQFSFAPRRKWVYASISHISSFHAYTVYLVVMGRITELVTSQKFKVVPIWTEQKRIKREKLQQQHQQHEEFHSHQTTTTTMATTAREWDFMYQPLSLPRGQALQAQRLQGFYRVLKSIQVCTAPK
ncbi:hypothetical protein BASA81_009110 [Batrachochytrium salamandrivorans]|nr:hypothetical protein BASA81_009110 [Batrachochytrium salamandrivorans]